MSKATNDIVAAIDVGSTKICCLIARVEDPERPPRVIGVGQHQARGVRGGAVVEMETAQDAILSAVHMAEQAAGVTLERVALNVSAGQPRSRMVTCSVTLDQPTVGAADVARLLEQGRREVEQDDRQLVHCIPLGYAIDGHRGIRDPRGMFGRELSVNLHVVSAQGTAIRNLAACLDHCQIEVETLCVAPYAAGLSSLVEDELELGATVIDLGGGTTTTAVFFDGQVVWTDHMPVGGNHVTHDIVHGLSTPIAQAERFKTLWGSAISSPADERELIEVPPVGEDHHFHANQISRAILTSIIQPRMEEILEMVRSRLEAGGAHRIAGRRVVLTGGGAQLQSVRELASQILEKQVRLGRPLAYEGLPGAVAGPAFATTAGLLTFAMRRQGERPLPLPSQDTTPDGLIGRIGQWFRHNL